MALLMLLSCFTLTPFAVDADTDALSDIVITPDDKNGVVMLSGQLTNQQTNADAGVLTETTFDSKNVFALTCVDDKNDSTNQYSGNLLIKGLDVPAADYSYILVHYYIDAPDGFDATTATGTPRLSYVDGWKTWTNKGDKTQADFLEKWGTLVIPITAADVADGSITDIEVMLLGWGQATVWGGSTIYIDAIAFSQDEEIVISKKDFVVAPGAMQGTVILGGKQTQQTNNADNGTITEATFEEKDVWACTCVADDDNVNVQYSGNINLRGLKVKAEDYAYLLVHYYIDTPDTFDATKATAKPMLNYVDGWKTWANKDEQTTADFLGKWETLVIPVTAADVADGEINEIEIMLLYYGKEADWNGSTIYIEAIAFSNDTRIDMNAIVEDEEEEDNGPAKENYTEEDYSVPFNAFFGGVPGTTVDNAATFDGKDVVKLTKGTGLGSSSNWNDAANDWPITVLGEDQSKGYGEEALTAPIDVRLGDYKYIVIKCYYDLNTLEWPTSKVPSLQLKQVDDAKPWVSFTAKAVASSGMLANAVVREDKWQYFVFDLTAPTFTSMVEIDTTKYPNGYDSLIKSIQLYMFANGGILNSALGDDDACYIEYFTFTNDYQALLAAGNGGNTTPGGDNTPGGDTTPGGDNTPETNAPETNAPETNAPTTTPAPTEEKKGCASVIGTSAMTLALIGTAGALVVSKKRKRNKKA